ncbi:glycosyltransferase family 2 protein, partial [bacterium]|nr:glycosyltransferase family 2 protein [bacterium]
MLKLPLISFVVTSFNYEKYILKTLESIKSQTYENFEIIAVDDCSSDKSVEVIEQFISDNQDLRITLIRNEENCGQLFSMIRGLKKAQGQFVSFVDSDDILFPDYAEKHIRVHLQTSVAFTSCQIAEIGEDDEIHTMSSISSPHCDNLDKLFSDNEPNYKILKHKRFGGWYWSPNSSAMYRKASIELISDYKNTDKWQICPDKFLFNFAHLIGGSAIIYTPLIGYR